MKNITALIILILCIFYTAQTQCVITGPSLLCEGGIGTFSVTGGTAPYIFTTDPPYSIVPVDSSAMITAGSSSFTVMVSDFNNVTCTKFVTVNIKSIAPTSINASNSTVCINGSVTLTAVGGMAGTGSNLKWYVGSCGGGSSIGTGPIITVNNIMNTTEYFVRYEDPAPCSLYTTCTSITITVNHIAAGTISGSSTVCSGVDPAAFISTMDANSSSGGTISYQWEMSTNSNCNSSYSIINGATQSTYDPPILSTTTYFKRKAISVLNGVSCSSYSNCVSVTVNPTPTVIAASNSPVCETATISLTASGTGGISYNWTSQSFSMMGQNVNRTNATEAMEGTYTVTATSAALCTATASIFVIVNPKPIATIMNNTPCEGETLNLIGGTGIAYSWEGRNFNSNLQSPMRPNAMKSTMDGTYTLTVTGTGGCTSTTSKVITIRPKPSINLSSNKPCVGERLMLFSNAIGNNTYSWKGPEMFTSNIQNPIIQNVSITAQGRYDHTITNAEQCSTIGNIEVTINELPVANAGNNVSICRGQSTTINASATKGKIPYQYNWDQNIGKVQSKLVSPQNTLNYIVTVTDANLCSSTDLVTVIVNPLPNPGTIIIPSNQKLCLNSSIQLSNSVSGGIWTSQNSSIISITPNGLIKGLNVGKSIINYTVIDANNCNNSTSLEIEVFELPKADVGVDVSICRGESHSLDVAATGGRPQYNYLWSNGSREKTQLVMPTTNTSYTITITDSHLCTATDVKNVEVRNSPKATINYTVNSGDNRRFEFDGTKSISGNANPISTYLWQLMPSFRDSFIYNIAKPVYTFKSSGIKNVMLSVKNNEDCISKTNTSITIQQDTSCNNYNFMLKSDKTVFCNREIMPIKIHLDKEIAAYVDGPIKINIDVLDQNFKLLFEKDTVIRNGIIIKGITTLFDLNQNNFITELNSKYYINASINFFYEVVNQPLEELNCNSNFSFEIQDPQYTISEKSICTNNTTEKIKIQLTPVGKISNYLINNSDNRDSTTIDGFGNSDFQLRNIKPDKVNTFTISVFSKDGCRIVNQLDTIFVYSIPSYIVSNMQSVCKGDPVLLDFKITNPNHAVEWSYSDNGNLISGTGNLQINSLPSNNLLLNYKIFNSLNPSCFQLGQVTFKEALKPDFVISRNEECNGFFYIDSLLNSSDYKISWISKEFDILNIDSPYNRIVLATRKLNGPRIGEIKVKVELGNSCKQEKTISLKDLPSFVENDTSIFEKLKCGQNNLIYNNIVEKCFEWFVYSNNHGLKEYTFRNDTSKALVIDSISFASSKIFMRTFNCLAPENCGTVYSVRNFDKKNCLDETAEPTFIISPNPNKGNFKMFLSFFEVGKYTYTIFQQYGIKLKQSDFRVENPSQVIEIDLDEDTPSGMYYIDVSNNNNWSNIKKFIIIK
jgi:hypothetical protein